jgi:hypothetical protein
VRIHPIPWSIPNLLRTRLAGYHHGHGVANWAVCDTAVWGAGDERVGAGKIFAVPQGRAAGGSCGLLITVVRLNVLTMTVVDSGSPWRTMAMKTKEV